LKGILKTVIMWVSDEKKNVFYCLLFMPRRACC
jgi:hypothetical protein